MSMSNFMGVTVAFLCLGFSGYARAQDFKGIDDTVFAKTAEAFGVIPGEIFPWMQGELELSMFSVGFFIAGCLVGSSFCRWQACKFVSARNKVGNPYAS